MARGKRTKKNKVDIFKEILTQLNLHWKDDYTSTGSSITGDALEKVLERVARKTGVPPKGLTENEELIWRLLHKSKESFVLALENINKVTITYRLESFVFLIVTAWELLLKAKLLSDGDDIYYDKNSDRTYDLKKCVRKIFKDNSAEFENLYQVDNIRNEAVHLFITIIPPLVMSLFQATITNYAASMLKWFKIDIGKEIPEGMLFLVNDLDPDKYSTAALKKQLSAKSFQYLSDRQRKILKKVKDLPENELGNFINHIDISLSAIKNPDKADVLVKYDQKGPGLIEVNKIKDVDDSHPYLTKHVIEILKRKGIDVTQHDISKVLNKVYEIKSKPEFCKTPKHHKHQPQYSNQFIEWIMERVDEDPDFFQRTRDKFSG